MMIKMFEILHYISQRLSKKPSNNIEVKVAVFLLVENNFSLHHLVYWLMLIAVDMSTQGLAGGGMLSQGVRRSDGNNGLNKVNASCYYYD